MAVLARSAIADPLDRRYPNPAFIKEVVEAFPDKAIANVEEARVLIAEGYTYVDVRPKAEVDEIGRVPVAVNIPLMNGRLVYDSKAKRKVMQKEPNPDFLPQIEKRFPSKEAKILIGCSDAKTYSMDALEALDEAGYVNLVALKGGYYAWSQVFDNKMKRRVMGEYKQEYTHDGDSCGIHSSGAGFERVDAADKWIPPKF